MKVFPIQARFCFLQAVSVAFWAFSTLHYDNPAAFDALAGRALELLATEEGFHQANEQANHLLHSKSC